MAKEKISDTSVGSAAPIVAYEGSAEAALIAPHRRVTIKSNVVGANFFPSASLYVDDLDLEGQVVSDDPNKVGDGFDDPEVIKLRKSPTLMDIELISNKIVYDAAGNPSASVTFKVRNSSGEKITAVNARVKVV